MNKRILMAVYGPIQTDARVIRSAKGLYEMGCDVELISWNSIDNYESPYFKSINFKIKKGAFSLFIFWYKVYRYIMKNKKDIDLVYFHDYYMPYLGKLVGKCLHKKWVYDAHELLVYKKGAKVSLREKIFCYLEKKSISKASLVIAANYERMRIIEHVYKLKNCTYVQNISDVSIAKASQSIEKENIIVYQGVLGKSRNVEFYVKMHQFLPDNFKLLLIGDGAARNELLEQAKELGIEDRVEFTGKVSQKELYEKSHLSKIGIVTYTMQGLNNYYCAPNKVFEYATLGIPMIGTPQPFLKSMFKKYKVGEIVKWDDKEGYMKAVNKIMENYDQYLKGMSMLLEENNSKNETERLQKYISELLIYRH